MMNFLLADKLSHIQIGEFVSKIFDCSIDRVKVFEMDEFHSLTPEELDNFEVDCVCKIMPVRGDASLILELIRYKITDDEVFNRIVKTATKEKVRCYIAYDDFYDWIYAGEGDSPRHVSEIPSDEDDYISFRPIDAT